MITKKINKEKITVILFSILGIVIAVDTFLAWCNIGSEQNNLTLGYCIGFIIASTQYPAILKNKYVMIPFCILVGQMLFSVWLI
tara:strand:+ start:1139 stop:1390 length:252 start_codon:yes stop_codon:yes gene_type:complete